MNTFSNLIDTLGEAVRLFHVIFQRLLGYEEGMKETDQIVKDRTA